MKRYIYFLYAKKANTIKIGFTREPIKRLIKLNAFSPEPLQLIKLVLGTMLEEKKIHRQFQGIRLHGEWFKGTKELFQYIDTLDGWSGGQVLKCIQKHGKLPDEIEEFCGYEIEE